MTRTGVLPGATRSAGRICGRVLRGCHPIPARLRGRRFRAKALRSGSVGLLGLALAVLSTALPVKAQPLAEWLSKPGALRGMAGAPRIGAVILTF